MGGQLYIDATPIDDMSPYITDWDSTNFGKLMRAEPTATETAGGLFGVNPLITAVRKREGKVSAYAYSQSNLDKWRIESDIRALFTGSRQIHLGSRFLNVSFLGGDQPENDSVKAPGIAGAVGQFVATDPYWYLNQPLIGLGTPVNVGDEWLLYDDQAIPTLIPEFIFDTNTFTITNWGNAITYGAGTVTNGPATTPYSNIYLKGVAGSTGRLTIACDPVTGAGTFLASSGFRLDPGENEIRIEDAGGSLLVLPVGFEISFGNTYMRYH